MLAFAAGVAGEFVRVVEYKMCVFEVESVLLQVQLSLCLIPDGHNLIVATI
jgi:hypothetical protein